MSFTRRTSIICCLVVAMTTPCLGNTKMFRGSTTASSTITARQVETGLRDALDASLRGGNGAGARRLASIEASLWHTFQALPKNSMGRLAPRSVRYMVHNYFAKEHGWQIKGLEPHGMHNNMTEMHEVSILQDKAPALVEAILETRQSDRGLSLGDTVVMVAVLERFIFDESIALLQASYTLNEMSASTPIDEQGLHEVLSSYLLIFEMGLRGGALTDTHQHQLTKDHVKESGGSWSSLVEFEQDVVSNFAYMHRDVANPFKVKSYSFDDASLMVEELAQTYGKWQNSECRDMKHTLMSLAPDGSGLVPLSKFYSQPENADFQLTESVEYLREIGALDETGREPRVRIANYVAGPSNCIASSAYYSVCCLSECEGLMNDLEGHIRAPSASADDMLAAVKNVSSAFADTENDIPSHLEKKLQGIAEHHGGQVPLHGRLFAQWLHYAFPNECPYPHLTEDVSVLSKSYWHDKQTSAHKDERDRHIEAFANVEATGVHAEEFDDEAEPFLPHWSDEEILPLLTNTEKASSNADSRMPSFRIVVQLLAMCLVLLRLGSSTWHALASSTQTFKNKKYDMSLPF